MMNSWVLTQVSPQGTRHPPSPRQLGEGTCCGHLGLTRSALRNSSRSSVPLPSRSQRLHTPSASAMSNASPSSARPFWSSPASSDRLLSWSRRRKNLGNKGCGWREVPGAEQSGRNEGTAHLARPWMPEAPRDRHCSRSFSTVASTVSMLGPGSLGSWVRERLRKVPARASQAPHRVPPTHSLGLVCPGTLLTSTLLAPACFVQCWQCVLPGRTVAKGQ